jgi:hypothetical protein
MPAVHTGTPPHNNKFYQYDLQGIIFFIHHDLKERQIEVFTAGANLNADLTTKEY